jgi:hypothetical protein
MPMRGELPTIAARTNATPSPVRTAWSHFVTTVSDPELQTIIAFCMIGILATLNAVLRFPDFGGLVAELNSFP